MCSPGVSLSWLTPQGALLHPCGCPRCPSCLWGADQQPPAHPSFLEIHVLVLSFPCCWDLGWGGNTLLVSSFSCLVFFKWTSVEPQVVMSGKKKPSSKEPWYIEFPAVLQGCSKSTGCINYLKELWFQGSPEFIPKFHESMQIPCRKYCLYSCNTWFRIFF